MIPEPTEAMLPCPFCGGDAHEAVGVRGDHGFAVQCGRGYCRASIRGYPTQQQAIARWNTREPEAGKLREALEEVERLKLIVRAYVHPADVRADLLPLVIAINEEPFTALSRNQRR